MSTQFHDLDGCLEYLGKIQDMLDNIERGQMTEYQEEMDSQARAELAALKHDLTSLRDTYK